MPGARWAPEALSLQADPARPRLRYVQLQAQTDGTPEGTAQAQLCHQRKVLEGTYAARLRFNDEPLRGADGDPVVQSFYATSPLAHDFDPDFSEIDWEYLPNGGWGSPDTRLYSVAWQTVRLEPWQAHNQSAQQLGSHAGWHVLVMQVLRGQTRWFVDGRLVARSGGRHQPVQPMAISFSLWFSPTGLLPPSVQPRVWQQQVDWVLQVPQRRLSPAQVQAAVQRLRRRGVAWRDTVPAPQPPLASSCAF